MLVGPGTLAAVRSGDDSEPLYQAERQLAADLKDHISCIDAYYEELTVTITLVDLSA